MAEDQAIQEENLNQDDSGTAQNGNPDGEERKLSKAELQQMASMMGRMVKDQVDSLRESLQPQQPAAPIYRDEENPLKKINEKWQNMIFEGNVAGAFGEFMEIHNRASANLTKTQESRLTKSLTQFSDQPYYKEIFHDMKEIATQTLGTGVQPEQAAEYAFVKAKANYLDKKLNGESGGGLNFETGGKPVSSKKVIKLPPAFKAQADKDIAAGYFENEAEWIAASKTVRRRLGLA